MARTVTGTELISRIRFSGDYDNSRIYTDARLLTELNRAIGELWVLLTQCWDDRYTTRAVLSISADAESVALPARFWKLRKVTEWTAASSTEGNIIRRAEMEIWHDLRATGSHGSPRRYLVMGDDIHIKPVLSSASDIRVWYIPAALEMASASETIDGYSGYEELLVQLVLYRLDLREGKPTGDRFNEIARLKADIKTAASARDANEPVYLEGTAPIQGWRP